MEGLPPDVERSLFKAVGAYLRATPPNELPAGVRPFAGFTEAAMSRHKKKVLALLDDEAMRALIDEWLREDKPRLARKDAENLVIALRRDDGWLEELQGRGGAERAHSNGSEDRSEKLAQSVEREKVKTKKAKEELQRVRSELEAELKAEKARTAKLSTELASERSTLAALEARREKAERDASAAAERAEREVRRARRDADKVVEQRDKLRVEVKEARRDLRAVKQKFAALDRRDASPRKTAKKASDPKALRERPPRKPLLVPKGRFEDAPETLDEWLKPGVTLIVDGYNVTKAERGFGELKLEVQRDRLIEEVEKLARRKKVKGTIVFDGSEVPPGTSRNRKGPVRIEFSAPDEIADDHIIALIERLPPDPVVLVTNDRELQDRARSLGTTVARSDQFLNLTRP